MLQQEVINAGQQIASDLIDANITKSMGNMGGHIIKPISEYNNADLIQKYLDDEIVSVEAIYTAMKRAEEKITTISIKTEIAALANRLNYVMEIINRSDADDIINELLQLSAV